MFRGTPCSLHSLKYKSVLGVTVDLLAEGEIVTNKYDFNPRNKFKIKLRNGGLITSSDTGYPLRMSLKRRPKINTTIFF